MKRIFYKDGQSYYYIHRGLEHFNSNEAMNLYKKQKEQNYTLAKNQFANDFLKSVSPVNEFSAELLNASMNENDIINELNSSFTQILNQRISAAISSYNLENGIKMSNQSINNFLDTGDLKELDIIFKQIGEAAKLLKSNRNEIYILLCGKNGYLKHGNLNKLNADLQTVLNEWEGKNLNISQMKLRQVAEKLQYIIKGIQSKSLNKKSIQKNINDIFLKDFGDYIVSKGVTKAAGLSLKDLRQSLLKYKEVNFESSKEMDTLISNSSIDSIDFKTSNKFKHFNIDIKEKGMNYNINLGFNTIWYNGENKRSNIIASQEKNFLNSVIKSFEKNIDYYYIYNTLGFANQNIELYNAMKEAIISKNITSLLSGDGNRDFSQYLVVNGKFYSVWDIINLIQNLNEKESSYNPIVLRIDGAGKVADMTDAVQDDKPNIAAAYSRARQQNQLISTLGITGHIYPSRLKNLIKI